MSYWSFLPESRALFTIGDRKHALTAGLRVICSTREQLSDPLKQVELAVYAVGDVLRLRPRRQTDPEALTDLRARSVHAAKRASRNTTFFSRFGFNIQVKFCPQKLPNMVILCTHMSHISTHTHTF